MFDPKLYHIAKNLIITRKKKEKELERRTNREKYLQEAADHEYKYNKEQWEALDLCIKHQQTKIIALMYDLHVIKKLIADIDKLQKEGSPNDWYA